MLFKKMFAASAALLLTIAAVAAPALVAQGSFDDGAKVVWQCSEDMKGTMKVLFVSNEGKKYIMDLSCGTEI